MTNTCHICGRVADHETFKPQERMFGWKKTFDYFKCMDCGCLQIGTIPHDLQRYYPSDYYSLSNQPTPRPGLLGRWINHKRLNVRLTGKGLIWERAAWRFSQVPGAIGEVVPYLAPIPHLSHSSRMLDIGCGEHSGWLGALSACGFTHLTGVDPFLKHPGFREGVRYLRAPLEEMRGLFDVVTLHHALEHIPDQHTTLRHVHRMLAPGGICLIRIPLVDSLPWKRYGLDWVELDAPRHLYLHSAASLGRLAELNGFDLVHVFYDGTAFEFAGSELYQAGIALTAPESFWVNPGSTYFKPDQMRAFREQARAANEASTAGRAAFYLRAREAK